MPRRAKSEPGRATVSTKRLAKRNRMSLTNLTLYVNRASERGDEDETRLGSENERN